MATKMRGFHLDGEAPVLTMMESMAGMEAKTTRDRTLMAVLCSKNLDTRYYESLYVSRLIYIWIVFPRISALDCVKAQWIFSFFQIPPR